MPAEHRKDLGTRLVGVPLSDVSSVVLECVISAARTAGAASVDPAIVFRYVRGFVLSGLPTILDAALPKDEDLARVDPHQVRTAALVLVRDALLRRHPPAAVDPILRDACIQLGADPAVVLAAAEPFDLSSMDADWARRLAVDLGLPPKASLLLVLGHSAWTEPG